jgi:hypothetical protein
MDDRALANLDPEDLEEGYRPQCSRCEAMEYAAECASLEAAESGAGLEKLRSDQYDLAYPQDHCECAGCLGCNSVPYCPLTDPPEYLG